jgi:hypothetical protein
MEAARLLLAGGKVNGIMGAGELGAVELLKDLPDAN